MNLVQQYIDHLAAEVTASAHCALCVLVDSVEQAADWQKKQEQPNARLPYAVQQRISSIANAILAEDALIKERQNERERLNRDFEANAARLTELLAHLPEQQEPTD